MSTVDYPFLPDYAVPPGETLRDTLVTVELSQADLAARTGLSPKHINQIIQGIAPITHETAMILERVTGVPAGVWNRLEAQYREALLRARPRKLTAEDEEWLTSLPVKQLRSRGHLPRESDRQRLLEAALAFFGVADREAWNRIWMRPVASFRRSAAFRSRPGSVASWLRVAELASRSVKTQPFDAASFRRALRQLRTLTTEADPNRLVAICAAAGVAVVFVPEFEKSRISGAAWWASPKRAVIALSDRYKKDDFFWFTLFHEAAHVLLHSKRETFIDDDSEDDALEEEANRFAADLLIPPEKAQRLHTLSTDDDVRRFAAELGIAPGIVVGRLHHDDIWAWGKGNKLRRSLRIIDGN